MESTTRNAVSKSAAIIHAAGAQASETLAPAAESWVCVVGRRDYPVDGIADYCSLLGQALASHGIALSTLNIPWTEEGRLRALWRLLKMRRAQQENWAVMQYTALAWSKRGFPLYALAVLWALRRSNLRCAVMFHEPFGLVRRERQIDRIRGAVQDWVVKVLHRMADKSIFAEPLGTIPWLPKNDTKSAFISIGSNIPAREAASKGGGAKDVVSQVAIFCLTEPPHVKQELHDIAAAMRATSDAGVKARLLFIGRGTQEAAAAIEALFRNSEVEYTIAGVRPPEEVSDALAECDAMLCVRGRLFPRRGSAIAGIVCGLPVIGYGGHAEGTPLAEAGVIFVPHGDTAALGAALAGVLQDATLRRELQERNARTQQQYYSWERIATAYVDCLSADEHAAESAAPIKA